MKISRCYHCGSQERTFYAEENGFSLVKCSECGLLYLEERPDDLAISQAHKQGRHFGKRTLAVTGRFATGKVRQYLEVLEDLYRGDLGGIRTWLDVGCGHGEFMLAVRQYSKGSVSITGTEPNDRKRESARNRLLDVGFFDLETHEGRYDVVSLLNVFSHLPDPPAFIATIKNLLRPGGEILLETGDTAALSPAEHYRPFYLPDHISFASEDIVVSILERTGFQVVSLVKYPYMQRNIKGISREFLKLFLPQHPSRFKYYLKAERYSETDMYIRAKLRT